MSGLQQFMFQPSQDFQAFLPSLILIALLLLVATLISIFIYQYRNYEAELKLWKRFHTVSHEHGLNYQEERYLHQLIKKAHASKPISFLIEEEKYETLVKPYERRKRRIDRNLIQSIRNKLFYKSFQRDSTIKNTHEFPTGIRLFMQCARNSEMRWWGKLIDIESGGMLVELTDTDTPKDKQKTSLHTDTHLEVVAHLPHKEPIIFMSWIKKVIPGEKTFYLMGHSNFLVSKSELKNNTRLVSPQLMEKRPKSTKSHKPKSHMPLPV
jgi:hypothetical protein